MKSNALYAVFILKHGSTVWLQQSIYFDKYPEAQAHAKLVRRAFLNIHKARVRRIRPTSK